MPILKRGYNVIVQNLTERDALFKVHNMEVFVVDSTGDPLARSPATYVWDKNTNQWILTAGSIFLETDDEALDTAQEIVDKIKSLDLDYLTDVDTTGVQTDDFLQYNGTQWVPKTRSTGWKDLYEPIVGNRTSDPETSPLFMDIGNGLWGWSFASDKINQVFVDFNINHDIKPGTLIYPSVRWTPQSYSTGVVRWELEYIVAKGHQQNEIFTGTPNQIILEQQGKGVIGEHMIAEATLAQAIPAPEPDSIIKFRLIRNGAHVNDTFYGAVIGLTMNLHYQSNTDSTLNKSPDFYV